MEFSNVLLSQVFLHVLDPPLAAHMGEPNQVQCRTLVGIIRKTKLSDYMKRKDPPSRAGLSFHGIRQRPTLPGDIVPLFRPQGAGDDILTKYIP